ncbi:unnamed protein product [Cyprideis torosa]|uniref:Uncharacterized protein n=1 Tax=Cyprideis torosa TaxID=163714 RepID=A0A7R8WJC9_9CRUS|nr:unnamed protein product [Cyprideis torosa]CAG0895498.1 unnamed protein product [Cyprideis torosa]
MHQRLSSSRRQHDPCRVDPAILNELPEVYFHSAADVEGTITRVSGREGASEEWFSYERDDEDYEENGLWLLPFQRTETEEEDDAEEDPEVIEGLYEGDIFVPEEVRFLQY